MKNFQESNSQLTVKDLWMIRIWMKQRDESLANGAMAFTQEYTTYCYITKL